MRFADRIKSIAPLGVGVSTEYGAGDTPGSLNVPAMHREQPGVIDFLEVGVEAAKGLDRHALAWVEAGLPTTYHFLDINLDEPEDFTADWLELVASLAAQLKTAYLCGDAGLWHFGPRDRGHMLLLPPILSAESAQDQARGIVRLRKELGYEVFPENPPGCVFLGDMHLMDYFAAVVDAADTGLLLDCAHLAIYQHLKGYEPLEGLDRFPLDRVVEMHVAGGTHKEHEGFTFIEDDHTTEILPATWQIFEYVCARAPNLKAVIFECERNSSQAVRPGFDRIRATVNDGPLGAAMGAAR